MSALATAGLFSKTPSEAAQERFLALEGGPLLLADWERAVFMHFELPAEMLQPHVPLRWIASTATRSSASSSSPYTERGRRRRLFRIWHALWRAAVADAELHDDSLLRRHLPWWSAAEYRSANFSPGAFDIWMGRPRAASAHSDATGAQAAS